MPETRSKAAWSAYYTQKRIVHQWLQVHLLGLTECQKVLEVGPALGLVTSLLVNAGYDVHTLDRGKRAFDQPDVPHLEHDICDLHGDEIAGYDAILCCETLEHIEWQRVGSVLSTFHRSGARYLIVSVPYMAFQVALRRLPEPNPFQPIFLDEESCCSSRISPPSRRAATGGRSAIAATSWRSGRTGCATAAGRSSGATSPPIAGRSFICSKRSDQLPAGRRAQQRQKPRRRSDIFGEGCPTLGLLRILAPGFDLKAFVELRGREGLGCIETALDQR